MDLEHSRSRHMYHNRMKVYWCQHCCCRHHNCSRNYLAAGSRENKNLNPTVYAHYPAPPEHFVVHVCIDRVNK